MRSMARTGYFILVISAIASFAPSAGAQTDDWKVTFDASRSGVFDRGRLSLGSAASALPGLDPLDEPYPPAFPERFVDAHTFHATSEPGWTTQSRPSGLRYRAEYLPPLDGTDRTIPFVLSVSEPGDVNLSWTIDPGLQLSRYYLELVDASSGSVIVGDMWTQPSIALPFTAGPASYQLALRLRFGRPSPPAAHGLAVPATEDEPATFTISGSDFESCELAFSLVTPPSHGVLSPLTDLPCTAGSPNVDQAGLTYEPAADFSGVDTFTFKVNDGTSDSNVATVTIEVDAENDEPIAQAQSVTAQEDTPLPITLVATDADGDSLTYAVTRQPDHGTVTGSGPDVVYTPDPEYSGADAFEFQAHDGQVPSNTARVDIQVDPADDAPIAAFMVAGPSRNVARTDNNLAATAAGARLVATTSGSGLGALDDSPFTDWQTASGQTTDQSMTVALPGGRVHAFDRIRLVTTNVNRAPKDFELWTSLDGTDFDLAYADTALISLAVRQEFHLGRTVEAAFVRLLVKNNHGGTVISLGSFEVINGDLAGAPSTLQYPDDVALSSTLATIAGVSSEASASPASRLIDGSTSTTWRSATGQPIGGQFVTVRLSRGKVYPVDRVRLAGISSTAGIKGFHIDVSTDPADPPSEASFVRVLANATAPQSNALLEYAFGATHDARHVRLVVASNYGGAFVEAAQLEVRPITPDTLSISSQSDLSFDAERLIDGSAGTFWRTAGLTGEYVRLRLAHEFPQLVERLVLQSNTSVECLKDFELWLSDTTEAGPYAQVVAGTLPQDGLPHEFTFAPRRAVFAKLVPRSSYAATRASINTLELWTTPSNGNVISVVKPTLSPAVMESPSLTANGAVVTRFSSATGNANRPEQMLQYRRGNSWFTTGELSEYAVVRLSRPSDLEGIVVSSHLPLSTDSVATFEVWASKTDDLDASFVKILDGTLPFAEGLQTFPVSGPAAEDVLYVKYVPRTNHGGTRFATTFFDVVAAGAGRVVSATSPVTGLTTRAELAFDGSASLAWTTNTGHTTDQSATVLLRGGASYAVYGVRITPNGTTAPKDFEVLVSQDGATFATAITGTLPQTTAAQTLLFPQPIEGRYVKFLWRNGYTTTLSVRELEVLALDPAAGAALIGVSSESSSAPALRAVDGFGGTLWQTTGGQTTNQFLKLLLPLNRTWRIDRIGLKAPLSATSPRDFEVWASTTTPDDASFALVHRGTMQQDGTYQTFFFPPASARYVKLVLVNIYGTSSVLQLHTFDVVSSQVGDLAPRFLDRSSDPDGDIVAFDWSFGDGGASSDRDPVHAYAAGEYLVALTATSSEGPQATALGTYLALAPPVPTFVVTPPVPWDRQTATYADTTQDPAGIALREWDFSDGTTFESTGPTATHAYPEPGTYPVTLRVWNTFMATGVTTVDVLIFNPPPVATDQSFVIVEDTSLAIVLDVVNTDSDPLTYQVSPPSHGTLTGTPPNLTYLPHRNFVGSDSFSYVVDDGDDTDGASVTITVEPFDGPVAILSIPATMDAGQPVPADGSGSFHRFPPKKVVSYRFDFGDGSTYVETASSAPDGAFDGRTTHEYPDPGLYTVTLTVVDDAVPPASDSISALLKSTPRDLVIRDVDASGMQVDPQTLVASGLVSARVRNLAPTTLTQAFTVLVFEDRDLDGAWDPGSDAPLGSVDVAPPLDRFAETPVSVPIAGQVTFAGTVVWAMADSGEVVAEVKESNNTTHSGFACQLTPPPPGQLNAGVDFIKTTFTIQPCAYDIVASPVVVDLEKDGIPEIVFVSYDEGSPLPCPRGNYDGYGVLRAVRGTDGAESLVFGDVNVDATHMPAVGDIDGDGFPEIVVVVSGSRVAAFEHTGQLKWTSTTYTAPGTNGAFSIADLDLDGTPEIVWGADVLNADGTVRWRGADTGATGIGTSAGYGPLSTIADLDLDGFPEVLAGKSVFHHDGSLYWQAPFEDGHTAVGEFDGDVHPEIVIVTGLGHVYMLEHDGAVKWGPVDIPTIGGGPPTIGDVNGDGDLEIGVAAASRYVVLEGNGALRWQAPTQDTSSNHTGSTIFDFEGDGSAEIVYGDEVHLRIFRGTDGAVLYSIPKGSRTRTELPVLADVDADGHAEIVAVANRGGGSPERGLFVIRGLSDNWAGTREVWNQHSYHIDNVEEDGAIPRYELPSSVMHGTYRLNRQLEGVRTGPDLVPSYLRFSGSPASTTITARVGNGGGVDVAAGVQVAFYLGEPGAGGVLLGRTSTIGVLRPGAFEDVAVVAAVAVGSEVWVVADDGGAVEECREDNNRHRATVSSNQPPVAHDDSVSTAEDTALPIVLSATDPEGDALAFSIVTPPTHGTLSGTPPNVVYTPGADYSGTDSFTFRANDGQADSNVATITIAIGAENDPPSALDQALTIDEDTSIAITLTGSDLEDDPLTFSIVPGSGPSHGTLTGTPPDVVYLPVADYFGPDSFRFIAHDGQLPSNEATIGITVRPRNDRPVADSQAVATLEDTTVAITLTGSDVDLDPITFRVEDGPQHGSLTGTAPDLVYTPAADYDGPDSFTFVTNDGQLDSLPATVSITVGPRNDLPEAAAQSVTTPEDTPLPITLVATDRDGDPLTFAIVTSPQHGALSGTAPDVVYHPAPEYSGPDSFTFKANDGQGDSNEATVSITVTPENDPPRAFDQAVSTREGTAVAITLTAFDVEGDPLAYAIVDSPAQGTLAGAPPSVTYTPSAGFSGVDTFTFRVNDGIDDSNVATVTITVAPNTRPVALDQSVSTPEDVDKAITLAGFDADGDPLTFDVLTQPAHGTLTGTAPHLVYHPAQDYHGADAFTFKVNDGKADSNVATVSITVTPVNDEPVANGQMLQTPEDTDLPVTLTGSDVDGDGLTFSVLSGPSHGTLTGTAPDLVYHPAVGYSGPDAFTFVANDGQADSDPATVDITVTPVNDKPVANDQPVTTDEDTAVAIVLTGSDEEDDPLTFTLLSGPSHGVLTGTPPDVTYMPSQDYNGGDSFTFKVNDGQADSDPGTVTITVVPVNDRPVARDLTVTTQKDTPVGVTLFATDVDGDPLTYAVTAPPTHGTLSGSAPDLTYTPASGYVGTDTFTYKASDGRLESDVATVTITVKETGNEPPDCTNAMIHPSSLWPPNHKMQAIQVLGVSDPDGDAVTVEVTAIRQDEPTNGLGDGDKSPDAILSPPQVRSERQGPPLGNGRIYHVTFTASDGKGGECEGTATLCVPHDNGPAPQCVDGGPLYDSTRQ